MQIRPYVPADRADVADICVRTGDGGADASGQYTSDALLPDVYALPYVDREPELAFVVDDGARVVGYILGTADTREFARWFVDEWWPTTSSSTPVPGASDAERALVASAGDAGRMLIDAVDDYPAHLHIDLLPEAQGHGHGRHLIETFAAAVAERGIRGLHLVVGEANTNAQAFYRRVGFDELARVGGGVVMGMLTEGQGSRLGRRSNQ